MTTTFLGKLRHNDMRSFFAWMLLLAVLFKAIIPTGYMPDMSAERKGLFSVTICTGDGPQTIQVDRVGNKIDGQPAGHEKTKDTGMCAFAASAHHALAVLFAPLITISVPFLPLYIGELELLVLQTIRSTAQARAPPSI